MTATSTAFTPSEYDAHRRQTLCENIAPDLSIVALAGVTRKINTINAFEGLVLHMYDVARDLPHFLFLSSDRLNAKQKEALISDWPNMMDLPFGLRLGETYQVNLSGKYNAICQQTVSDLNDENGKKNYIGLDYSLCGKPKKGCTLLTDDVMTFGARSARDPAIKELPRDIFSKTMQLVWDRQTSSSAQNSTAFSLVHGHEVTRDNSGNVVKIPRSIYVKDQFRGLGHMFWKGASLDIHGVREVPGRSFKDPVELIALGGIVPGVQNVRIGLPTNFKLPATAPTIEAPWHIKVYVHNDGIMDETLLIVYRAKDFELVRSLPEVPVRRIRAGQYALANCVLQQHFK